MNDNAKEMILQCKNDLATLANKLGRLRTRSEDLMLRYHAALGMNADEATVRLNPLPDLVAELYAEIAKIGEAKIDDRLYGPLDDAPTADPIARVPA